MSIVKTPDRERFIIREIEHFNSFILSSSLRASRYLSMAASPAHFFRGTAHIFYKDLSLGIIPVPADWESTPSIKTWIQGDFHFDKIGYCENNKGEIVFDLNNFDESYIAPFYWDLIRFVTAMFLVKDDIGFECPMDVYSAYGGYFLETYRKVLEEGSNDDLDRAVLPGGIKNKLVELSNNRSNTALLDHWTIIEGDRRIFNLELPELSAPGDEVKKDIISNWSIYLSSVYKQVSEAEGDYFTIKDIARYQDDDVENIGTDIFYILIQGDSEDKNGGTCILKAKQQRLPSMFFSRHISRPQYYSFFASHAGRCLTSCKALLKNPDDHFGLFIGQNASYFVEKASPYSWKFSPGDFTTGAAFEEFLSVSARALAQGHNRSDKHYDETYIPYRFEDAVLNALEHWDEPLESILELGKWYAQQVIVDYGLFLEYLENSSQGR